jgi:hypothetical protein
MMSTFNRFCAKAKNFAAKTADKIEKLGDQAALTVKIKALEIRIDEQYELLGALVYRDLHTEESLEDEKLQIIATIDGLFDELAVLKGEAAPAANEAEESADEPVEAPAEEPATEA